jgi:prefoldin beta subunit
MSSSTAPAAASVEFKAQLDALQALVKRTRDLVSKQQQLEAQAHENSMVEEELNNVAEGPSACVYKLSARVLVRQDLADAKATVKSRLELIAKGAKDTEAAIKRAMAEQDEMRAKLQALQRAQQQSAQTPPREEA